MYTKRAVESQRVLQASLFLLLYVRKERSETVLTDDGVSELLGRT